MNNARDPRGPVYWATDITNMQLWYLEIFQFFFTSAYLLFVIVIILLFIDTTFAAIISTTTLYSWSN